MIANSLKNKQPHRLVLLSVAMLLSLAALDQTVVSTALPTIIYDLGELNQMSWVVTSYLLSSTVVAPLYGKLGDMYGRKIMMQIAIIIFILGSLMSGLSTNIWTLIISRLIQGIGGGGLFVLAFTVVGDVVPSRSRGKIQGLFAVVFGLSSILGPLIGGFFVEKFTWNWIFYINIPIGLISLIILNFSFKKKTVIEKKEIDFLGLFLLIFLICLIIYLTSDFSNTFINIDKTFLFIVFPFCLAYFIYFENKKKDPFFPIYLFKNKNFFIYSFIGFLSGAILFSLLIFVPFFFQLSKGLSPSHSGILMIALTFGIIAGAWISGVIMSSFGKYKFLPTIGSIILIVGLFGIIRMIIIYSENEIYFILFFLILIGLGLGPQLSVITTIIQNDAPAKQMGVSTSSLILMRQIGGNIFISIFSYLFLQKIKTEYLKNRINIEKSFDIFNLNNFQNFNLSLEDQLVVKEIFEKGFQSIFLFLMIICFFIFLLSLFGKENKLSKVSHSQKS